MNIYTKHGDKGITELVHTKNVSKSDDRIQLVGTVDELTSHIGVVKSMLDDGEVIAFLEDIQGTLITLMAGVADPYERQYRIGDDKTEILEAEIDRMEGLFERPRKFILPGKTLLSAEIDVTRTVARRAERALALVGVRFGADTGAKKFMNRLADYLYVLARYTDAKAEGAASGQGSVQPAPADASGPAGAAVSTPAAQTSADAISASVVREVLRQMGIQERMTLESAKRLIERIEEEANRRGKKAVIAVCNPEGNPIAVHVMDGAFLVSFDVAVKKAYTSVAVKMSTMELSKLAQPGQTFFGVDKLDDGKIVIFGGGVPLKAGDTIIGGLGISGGTGEEDHSLAEYALSILDEVL